MFVVRMGERTNQCPFIRALRKHRQMFANMNTGGLRADGIEFTSDFARRIRFKIKTFVLCQAAGKENINDFLPLGTGSLRAQSSHIAHP